MRAHHAAMCGLAVPIFAAFTVWALVNWMIAFRSDPQAYAYAEEYFGQLHTLFDTPAP